MITQFVKVKRLLPSAILPTYAHHGDAGFDLSAAGIDGNRLVIPAGERVLVGTGLAFEIPFGYEMQIRPRSGLAANHGITVLNAPGTIDHRYRKEVKVILHNASNAEIELFDGDRIAQGVLAPVYKALFEEVDAIEETDRGGFGSTGR